MTNVRQKEKTFPPQMLEGMEKAGRTYYFAESPEKKETTSLPSSSLSSFSSSSSSVSQSSSSLAIKSTKKRSKGEGEDATSFATGDQHDMDVDQTKEPDHL